MAREDEENARVRRFWHSLTPEQRQQILDCILSEYDVTMLACEKVELEGIVEYGVMDALKELPMMVYYRISQLPEEIDPEQKIQILLDRPQKIGQNV